MSPFLIVSLVLNNPFGVQAADLFTDNFNAGSDGNLSSYNSWTNALNNWQIAADPGPGGKLAQAASATGIAAHTWSASAQGTLRVEVGRTDATKTNNFVTYIGYSGNAAVFIIQLTGGNVKYFSGTYQNWQTYSNDGGSPADILDIQWDDANQADKARYRWNNGAWSSWLAGNGAYTTIDRVSFEVEATAQDTTHFDNIQVVDAVGDDPFAGGGGGSACTPVAGSIWSVNTTTDDCHVSGTTYHNNALECFGSGKFTVESGGVLRVTRVTCPNLVIKSGGQVVISQ